MKTELFIYLIYINLANYKGVNAHTVEREKTDKNKISKLKKNKI